jgi:hypothetical protein
LTPCHSIPVTARRVPQGSLLAVTGFAIVVGHLRYVSARPTGHVLMVLRLPFRVAAAITEPSVLASVESSLILIVMGGPSPAREPREPIRGANVFRLPQTGRDSVRALVQVRGLPVGFLQTEPDHVRDWGSRGRGSNLAVPTAKQQVDGLIMAAVDQAVESGKMGCCVHPRS